MTQGAILYNGDRILVMKGQTLCWSESGKRLELWHDEPLLLLKRWAKSKVFIADWLENPNGKCE